MIIGGSLKRSHPGKSKTEIHYGCGGIHCKLIKHSEFGSGCSSREHFFSRFFGSKKKRVNKNDFSSPKNIPANILKKEKEIIIEELKNSGKDSKIVDKIALGKINKFINDNTLLNQEWIMEPKKKVKDILKKVAGKNKIEIKRFIRFKVGEGI